MSFPPMEPWAAEKRHPVDRKSVRGRAFSGTPGGVRADAVQIPFCRPRDPMSDH